MRKDNPAVYECPKTKSTLHHWVRRDNGTAYCIRCNLELNKQDADEVFTE